jgi:hypothetical protein
MYDALFNWADHQYRHGIHGRESQPSAQLWLCCPVTLPRLSLDLLGWAWAGRGRGCGILSLH